MKTVLILVLSTDMRDVQGTGPEYHYKALADTQMATWDSVEVEGVETIFYFANANGRTGSNVLCCATADGFFDMGRKTLAAFEYALANRKFDYIFRANASLYVHKPGLLRYIQTQPETNLALGVGAPHNGNIFLWGPGYLLSRDVVQKVVDAKAGWDHLLMDDVALSMLLDTLGIPLDNRGSLCSVALGKNGYDLTYYGNGYAGGAHFASLSEVRELQDQFAFRTKCDSDRTIDVKLMHELFAVFSVDNLS